MSGWVEGETGWEYSEGGVGYWMGRQCAIIVREKESEWVSEGGTCHYVMDLHMAKHPGTIYYMYIEKFYGTNFL